MTTTKTTTQLKAVAVVDTASEVLSNVGKSLLKGMAVPFPSLLKMIKRGKKQQQEASESSSSPFHIGLSLQEGFVALALYLLIGVVAYSFVFEKWSIVDALYFSVVTFSTVGYGDLCPSNAASKLFTCIFGMGGISFLGAVIATVGGRVVQAELDAVQQTEEASRTRLIKLFEHMPHVLEKFRHHHHDGGEQSSEHKVLLSIHNVVLKLIPSFTIVLGGGFIMNHLNAHPATIANTNMSLVDTIYYSFITATTIGYGEFAPKTQAARIFAIAFIPLAVGAAGEFLSGIALALVHRRQQQVYEQQLSKKLQLKHLQYMDANHDGHVSREEYVTFMLMEMGRVTKEELEELDSQFERLDADDSGYLSKTDLRLMAKLQGANVIE